MSSKAMSRVGKNSSWRTIQFSGSRMVKSAIAPPLSPSWERTARSHRACRRLGVAPTRRRA